MPATLKSVAGELVPMPTLPALSTIKRVAVELPTTKLGPVKSVCAGLMENLAHGEVVPTPTKPEFATMNAVRVEDPTTKAGALEEAIMLTESSPHGVEEEIPAAPYTLMSLKAAVVEACREKGAPRSQSAVVVEFAAALKFVVPKKGYAKMVFW